MHAYDRDGIKHRSQVRIRTVLLFAAGCIAVLASLPFLNEFVRSLVGGE